MVVKRNPSNLSTLQLAVMWVMGAASAEEFLRLPGMDHTSDNYLFAELDETAYEDFARHPPPEKIRGATSSS
jgi:hypothetical protein